VKLVYWSGAAVMLGTVVSMLVPPITGALFGIERFEPGPDYRYAIAVGAALKVSWAVLLLWGGRSPVERRVVLALTAMAIVGIAGAEAMAVASGLFGLRHAALVCVGQLVAATVLAFCFSRLEARARVMKTEATRRGGVCGGG
jgi:hypothetical protein